MKMNFALRVNLLALLALMGLWIVGCNPGDATLTTPETHSTAAQTLTATPIIRASITPASTWTARPPTFTPLPASTYIPYPNSTPLSMLLLSIEDIQDVVAGDRYWAFVEGICGEFIDRGNLTVLDRSIDLQSSCPIECTRQIWSNPPNTVIITMIRIQDGESSKLKAAKLYYDLQPYHYEWGKDAFIFVNTPVENTHIGVSEWNLMYILTTSIGPIAIKIEAELPPVHDALYRVGIMAAFANLQINKLQQANIVP
ncbi:MAG: hypothetical protein N2C13_05115 [Chloroflexota bacterium]